MVRMVCWNIARSLDAYEEVRKMEDVDVALLQEVGRGAADQMADVIGDEAAWNWDRSSIWPAVVRLSKRVQVDTLKPVAPESEDTAQNTIAVSDSRTLAAALVRPLQDAKPAFEPFLVFSTYARWLRPNRLAGFSPVRRGHQAINIYSDGSAHRVISDISAFIGHTNPLSHRLLVAGDLNAIYGATDDSRLENPPRARTIFARMQALGLEFRGPQCRQTGRASPAGFAGRHEERANIPHRLGASSHARRGHRQRESTRLCVRLSGLPYQGTCTRHERPRRIRTERPLPDTDRRAVTFPRAISMHRTPGVHRPTRAHARTTESQNDKPLTHDQRPEQSPGKRGKGSATIEA